MFDITKSSPYARGSVGCLKCVPSRNRFGLSGLFLEGGGGERAGGEGGVLAVRNN